MSHVDKVRKTYHITDQAYQSVEDLMKTAREALRNGEDYDHFMFEKDMKKIVKAPKGDPEYDYHMVIEVAQAFLLDRHWEEVYLQLYQNEGSEKAFIERICEERPQLKVLLQPVNPPKGGE